MRSIVALLCVSATLALTSSLLIARQNKSPLTRCKLTLADEVVASAPSSGQTVLKCDGLTKSYTGTPQFENINFNLAKGSRVGLIGINGAGKSTLLKCLAGIMSPDKGNIEYASNSNVVYVDQEPDWKNIMVYEALFSGNSPEAIATRMYMKSMEPGVEDDELLGKALEKMEESKAWDYQTQGFTIAEKLNINNDFMYKDVNILSGGEKKRVGLSAALLMQPDVLLLDEPTNHLDADALDWLSDYLKPGGKDKDMTMLLVTHDRYFLERTCAEIVELDRSSLYRYPGNYARYLELKNDRLAAEDAESERARIKLRRESEWMAKQPRARQAKSKARQAQFYELVDASQKRVEQQKVDLSNPDEIAKQKRLGGVVVEFKNGGYVLNDRVLLKDFSYNFRQRDRIGICGPNGAGKTTLIKIISGQLPLTTGSVRLGETAIVGYYEQKGLLLTPEQEKMPVLKFVQEEVEKATPQEKVKVGQLKITVEEKEVSGRRNIKAGKSNSVNIQIAESTSSSGAVSERDAMQLLQRFNFPAKRFYDRVGQLSGGERRRLQLLQILAKRPNVLLLDEPSNDLDISTLQSLEEYLTEVFEGCLVIVSHDNFFVNKVCDHLFVFSGDQSGIVRDFQGTYTEYLQYRRDESQRIKSEVKASKKEAVAQEVVAPVTPTITAATPTSAAAAAANPLTYNERKEYNKLEKEISKLENQVKEFDLKINSSNGKEGYSVLAEWSAELNKLKELMATKEEKWLAYHARDV